MQKVYPFYHSKQRGYLDEVYPLWFVLWWLAWLKAKWWLCPTDSFAFLLVKKDCKLTWLLWKLIDERFHDFVIYLLLCYKSWLAIKMAVLGLLRSFAAAKSWEVLSCSWFCWCSVTWCFHDFCFLMLLLPIFWIVISD
jgi:hypothetical protein